MSHFNLNFLYFLAASELCVLFLLLTSCDTKKKKHKTQSIKEEFCIVHSTNSLLPLFSSVSATPV